MKLPGVFNNSDGTPSKNINLITKGMGENCRDRRCGGNGEEFYRNHEIITACPIKKFKSTGTTNTVCQT